MSNVRIASVGLGRWGRELARAAQSAGLEVGSCYSRTPETREEFAEEIGCDTASSLEEILEDPSIEGVLIATSNASHRAIVEAAAAAGKHVFIEKPLTLSVEDARACVQAASDAGIVLQVGFQRRRLPAHRKLKQLIDDGTIGDIEMLEANHSLPGGYRMPESAWRWDEAESPLGSMTSLGIHQIETFHYLAGPIARVAAVARAGRTVTIDEATAMVFEFANGSVGTVMSSFFTPWHISLAVHGTDGSGFADRDAAVLHIQKRDDDTPAEVPLEPIDAVADQLVEFGDCIRKGARPEVGGPEGLAVVAVLEAAQKSAASGKFETVELI